MKKIFTIIFFLAIYVESTFGQSTTSVIITGGTIGSSQTICSGGDPLAFTETTAATGNSLTYQWQSSSNGTSFSDNNLPATRLYDIPSGLSSTTYYRRITFGLNNTDNDSAYSNVVIITILNIPAVATVITGFPNVCDTQINVPYSINPIEDASNYIWTYTGTGISIKDSTNSTSINFLSSATSGTLTVTGINVCGSGNPSPGFAIAVSPLPEDAGVITGTSVVCQGATTQFYSIAPLTNVNSYQWVYTGNGALISGSTNSITIDFLPSATSGVLTVQGVNNCSNGLSSPAFPITVNKVPQGNFIGNSICTSDTRNGQLIWIDQSGTGTYDIIYNDGTTNRTQNGAVSGQPFNAFTQPTATNKYKLISVSSNNCARSSGFNNDTAIITVSSQVAVINNQPNNTSVCKGSDASFFVSANGVYAYQWQVSTNGGANYLPISSAGTNPIYSNYNTATLSVSGSTMSDDGNLYKCAITASCGSDIISDPATLTIHQLPDSAGTINGPSKVCQKQNDVIYTVPLINNATDYVWTYTGSGATLTVSSNTVSINFSSISTPGYLEVMGITPYCNGPASTELFINVILSPTSAGLISGTHVVCQNQTAVTYQVPIFHSHSVNDYPTFTWQYSGTGATISGPTDPMTIDFSSAATSGILTVMRTQACGNGQISPNYTITVNPAPAKPATITGSDTVCYPGQVLYSTPAINGATRYIWKYSGNGTTISDSTNAVSINFLSNATSGNLTVRAINSTCNGLISDNHPISYTTCPTGIEENELTNSIMLYPNPSNGIFNITVENANFKYLSISIFNALGDEVYSSSDKNISSYYSKHIDLSALSKGLYYVKLLLNSQIKTFKVIIF